MGIGTQTIDIIKFGNLEIDPKGRRVIRSGKRIAMGPQEFKLLETLIANRRRVLTGDELRILVWSSDPTKNEVPAGDVNALYVSVRKLRAALGDHGKFILNIPKVGYTIAEEALEISSQDGPTTAIDYGTPFVGRVDEIAKVSAALDRSRLVTLTGPPGIGKSRLAVESAKTYSTAQSASWVLVDLAPVADEGFVAKAVLTALGVSEQPGREAETEIIEALRNRQTLLVIDNCEHLVPVVSSLVDKILRNCREVRILATSREPLLLTLETVIAVGPLALPTDSTPQPLETDAVRLFVDLAKQRRPDFDIARRDITSVVQLCRQLEGIPVAIELAAVQVDAYPVDQILAVMKDRLRLLQRRGGDSSRHQTLEGAIGWSYGLLSSAEKLLLQRLSVFAGGWTTEMVTAVCSGDGIAESDVPHLLAGLVRRSLIQLGTRKGYYRYRILEMIRQFARQRLIDDGGEDAMRRRHTSEFLKLVEAAFEAGEKDEWPAIIEAEYDNIRAALRRTITLEEDISAGLRFCGFLVRFWFNHGHLNEARRWTTEALAKDDGKDAEARAWALVSAGFFFGQMPGSSTDPLQAKEFFRESLEIFRGLGNQRNYGFALLSYAFLLNRLGEYDAAIASAEEALETFRPIGDHANLARAGNNLGLTLMDTGEFAKARPVFDTALKAARRAKDLYLEAVILHNIGDTSLLTGDLENAERFLDQSIEIFRPLEHRALVARTILLQGELLAARSEFASALEQEKIALQQFVELGDNQGIATALETLGSTLFSANRELRTGTELLAAAGALRRKINISLGPSRQRLIEATERALAKKLGRKEFDDISKNAQAAPTAEAIEAAMLL